METNTDKYYLLYNDELYSRYRPLEQSMCSLSTIWSASTGFRYARTDRITELPQVGTTFKLQLNNVPVYTITGYDRTDVYFRGQRGTPYAKPLKWLKEQLTEESIILTPPTNGGTTVNRISSRIPAPRNIEVDPPRDYVGEERTRLIGIRDRAATELEKLNIERANIDKHIEAQTTKVYDHEMMIKALEDL